MMLLVKGRSASKFSWRICVGRYLDMCHNKLCIECVTKCCLDYKTISEISIYIPKVSITHYHGYHTLQFKVKGFLQNTKLNVISLRLLLFQQSHLSDMLFLYRNYLFVHIHNENIVQGKGRIFVRSNCFSVGMQDNQKKY